MAKRQPTKNQATTGKMTPIHNAILRFAENVFATRESWMKSLTDPRRDIDKECGYPDIITTQFLSDYFNRHSVAARVVEIEPHECWKRPPEVYETEDDEETEFEKVLNQIVSKFNLWEILQRIDVLSGIHNYGVLLIGIDDGKELDQAAEFVAYDPYEEGQVSGKTRQKRKVLFLRCFDQTMATITKLETSPTNPRFGLPTEYELTFASPHSELLGYGTKQASEIVNTTKKVHWTRILHVCDNRTTSEILGTPRMQRVFNDLQDYKKIRGGSGEMFWKGGFPGYSFEIMPDAIASMNGGQDISIDKEAMREEMELFSNSLQRYMALVGVSAKSLAPQVSDPTKHLEACLQAICIAKAIPLRVFMGSEQAQLASGQDKQTWNERVQHRQLMYVVPLLIRPFISALISLGCLPKPAEDFKVEFPDLFAPSEEQVAGNAVKFVQALSTFVSGNVEAIFPLRKFLTTVLKMSEKEADSILEDVQEEIRITEDPNDLAREMMDKKTSMDQQLQKEDKKEEKKKEKRPKR